VIRQVQADIHPHGGLGGGRPVGCALLWRLVFDRRLA